ncbi:hypothetical protein [Lacrimispora indolis]|uniref:hypothetical protein n=1 Tax=Lacrimispora indolis TaxID=69825 RepID=UPI00045EC36D|nr:hypothetical protein [Lacrimispora indolis]
MAEIYGTIGIRPMGEYNPDTKYELLNLVNYDGSSYVAHTEPPLGTLPSNTAYWQVSAQGTSKATADSVGTVKPDGVTTEVSADGTLSAKTASQSTAGMVKGSQGITVGTGGAIDVNTAFTQATELANIIAGEAIAQVLGKISKAIATTMNLDQNALLKNMLTNMDANDQNKINTAAYVHTLTERIGMSTELTAGANLTAALNALNSNLPNLIIAQSQTLPETAVPANGYVDISYTPTPINGYTPFQYSLWSGGNPSVGIVAITSSLVRLRNFSGASINATPIISVTYKRA